MNIQERARKIKLLLLDVDGVLTDGRLFYGPDGEELKIFNVHDGYGIKEWHKAGFQSGIISGRSSPTVSFRAKELGIRYVFQDRDDKLDVLNQILDQAGLSTGECAFIGDDTLDVPVFEKVGLAVAVANAHNDAKSKAHYITQKDGGNGAVREVTDLMLRAKRSNGQAIK